MAAGLIRVGTRASPLAKAQTAQVIALLQAADPEGRFETVEIVTSGDRAADAALADAGGKGLFVKELEEALLSGAVDLAVHSAKDLPATLAPGLEILSVPPREEAADLLATREPVRNLGDLPDRFRVGTASLRRRAQILAANRALSVAPLRGNVDTRLRRLREGRVDGVVLAAAGLSRLRRRGGLPAGWEDGLHFRSFTEEEMLPAPGQGTLALEGREERSPLRDLVARIEDRRARAELEIERGFLLRVGGDCRTPLAARAHACSGEGETVRFEAAVWTPDGSRLARAFAEGSAAAAGASVWEALLAAGLAEILGKRF